MTRDAVRRVIRTFVQSFLGLLLPGLFGWLHSMTEWANSNGQAPFPDATSLAYLGVAAVLSGCIAVVSLIQNLVEDASGKGLLRTPPAVTRGDRGTSSLRTTTIAVLGIAVLTAGALIYLDQTLMRV